MNAANARLWEVVEEAALAVTDSSTGRFHNKAFVEEIRARLEQDDAPQLRQAINERLAHGLAPGIV
ncbi:hypothetical protein, partial [Streptomyces anulatus]|uniref:hypothetical protein n=1 Tax=Streptomyces anulatus TaxID=1892 RepID=UPI00342FD863